MKTTNPKDYIELLGVYCVALKNGLIEKEEVIRWVDNIIINDSEPDYFFIELSLKGSKSINDIISHINELIGLDRSTITGRVIFGYLYKQYSENIITLKKLVDTINCIIWETGITENERRLICGIDDEYYCAIDGIYGSINDIEKVALRFLEIYKDFTINNFNDWNKINETIDSKIKTLAETNKHEQSEEVIVQKKNTVKKWWKFW